MEFAGDELRHKGGVDYRINQAGFPRGPPYPIQ